jgi:hypothetical protein
VQRVPLFSELSRRRRQVLEHVATPLLLLPHGARRTRHPPPRVLRGPRGKPRSTSR